MKNRFNLPATQVYLEFKTFMQSMASNANQLQPFDFDALTRSVIGYHKSIGSFNRAFYAVVDMQKGDFSWQYGLSEALGGPLQDFSLVEFLDRLHPDYLHMFRFWAMAINETAYAMSLGEEVDYYIYHISLPLRREDHSYHWYTQHSFVLERDAAGHYVTHINFYDYGGQWYPHNRSPFLPFVTNYNQPSPDMQIKMYATAAPRIREFFTHTEQLLLDWHIKGKPDSDKLRMQQHTLNEHNSNILKKITSILLTDFKSAREAAMLLFEVKLWELKD